MTKQNAGKMNRRHGLLCSLGAAALAASAATDGTPPQAPFRLLFSGPQDVADTWGMIHFGTTPLQRLSNCPHPGFELSTCSPRDDGAWDVYGLTFKEVAKHADQVRVTNTWSVVHATTRDAVTFENVETVYEAEPGAWTFNHAMTYNPEAKEFLLLKLRMDNFGFQYTAFFSPDGRVWKQHPQAPLFYDGDAISLFWSPVLHRFVLVSKSLQPAPGGSKRIVDHGGKNRRVIAFRTSPDGRVWEPSDSMEDVWNRGGRWKPRPDAVLTVPDASDPPDLEFYSGNGFWYRDRCYLMVLNYAASALSVRKHAPQMDTEWWAGRDGLRWERPGRHVNALGDAFPGNARITHNPLLMKGQLLFRFGGCLVGMKQDRLSFVGARANAEFSTVSFTMPAGDLLLNAACPSPERPFAAQQAYILASVLDDKGAIVPGFEADTCALQKSDSIELPLLWKGKSARELAGQRVRLRFYLRSANIYAVSVRE